MRAIPDDMVCTQDCRTMGDSYNQMRNNLLRACWRAVGTQAAATGAGSASGGVLIAYRKHLYMSRWADIKGETVGMGGGGMDPRDIGEVRPFPRMVVAGEKMGLGLLCCDGEMGCCGVCEAEWSLK